jgi:tetrahydromethanopterin S-methyltransferase subunit G
LSDPPSSSEVDEAELGSELLGPGSGSSCGAELGDDLGVVLGIVLGLVVDLDLDRVGLSAF